MDSSMSMTIDQFRERMATGEPIIGGSDLHMQFHQFSQEALRITEDNVLVGLKKTDSVKL